jgi:hypothetical protein
MKEMADFSAIHSHFESYKLPCFTLYRKSRKPMKTVIWCLSASTLAEDISHGLVNLGFNVISIRQISAIHHLQKEQPLFLITLPRTSKSYEILKLMSLCHIAVRLEAYKAQTSLT